MACKDGGVDHSSSPPRVWAARLLGPGAGLALAFCVLLVSVLLGKVNTDAFARAVAAIAVACMIAVGLSYWLFAAHLDAAARRVAAEVSAPQFERLDAAAAVMHAVVSELRVTMAAHVEQLLGLDTLDDGRLVQLECADVTREVFICRQEMGDEFDSGDAAAVAFRTAVARNLARNVRYTWITEDNPVSRHRARVVRDLFPDHEVQVAIHSLPREQWRLLPFSFEAVFYMQGTPNGARTLAFADVSFGNGNARAWRRLGPRYAADWFGQIEEIADIGRLRSPSQYR